MGCRWVSVSRGAQNRWHRDTLKGLVTTRGTPRDVDAGPTLHRLSHALRPRWRRWLPLPQCLTAEGQGVGFTAICQHAVMTNPHKARRHDMEQEALDKGVGLKLCHLQAVALLTVAKGEANLITLYV